MSKYLFLLLSLFLCACRSPVLPVHEGPHYTQHAPEAVQTLNLPVWFDSDVSSHTRMEVAEALRQWNIAMNGHARYYVAGETSVDALIYLARGNPGLQITSVHYVDAPAGILGWVDDLGDSTVNIVDDNLVVPDMTDVILHEIGHSLGLPHTPKKGSLMYPYYTDQPGCIDEDTARALAYLRGWEGAKMNWCTP